ncbi:MAG: alpha/beta hydrolase [Chitinophagaceae bacterium]
MKVNINYGTEKSQYGELHIPNKDSSLGVICLLHGGFWTMPYGLDQFNKVVIEFLNLGYCLWNIEYRRIGEANLKWHDTFDDAVNATNHLINIKRDYDQLNIDNVYIVGHSAGGHLAVWLNSQNLKINVKKVIGLSPILDLETAYYENAGNGAVGKLLQGSPNEFPDRYLFGSPIKLNNKNSPEIIIHGNMDDAVPIKWSQLYNEKFSPLATSSKLIELKNCGHMDFIDPESNAFITLKAQFN